MDESVNIDIIIDTKIEASNPLILPSMEMEVGAEANNPPKLRYLWDTEPCEQLRGMGNCINGLMELKKAEKSIIGGLDEVRIMKRHKLNEKRLQKRTGRRLIHEGTVRVGKKDRHLFLFSDAIVITKEVKEEEEEKFSYRSKPKDKKYSYKGKRIFMEKNEIVSAKATEGKSQLVDRAFEFLNLECVLIDCRRPTRYPGQNEQKEAAYKLQDHPREERMDQIAREGYRAEWAMRKPGNREQPL